MPKGFTQKIKTKLQKKKAQFLLNKIENEKSRTNFNYHGLLLEGNVCIYTKLLV